MKKYFILILLSLFLGCDSQSPEARFVSGLNVSLFFDPPHTEQPFQLDLWEVSSDDAGRNIYSASFGFVMQVTAPDGLEDSPVAGIRVDCYIEHCDPFDAGYDIWDKYADIGKKYGFVNAYPAQTAHWNFDESHASVKTDTSGFVAFFIGLGKPEPPSSEIPWGWEWPRGSGTMVSTAVKLRFTIRKWNGPIEQECHTYFIRPQAADFWEPEGVGVYYASFSSLNPAPGIWGMLGMTETETKESARPATLPGINHFPRLEGIPPVDLQKRTSADDAYLDEDWFQLTLGDGGYWSWNDFNALNVLVSPDPCIPNDANDIFSSCEPYAFFSVVEFPGEFYAYSHTVILKSFTAEEELVSWLPIKTYIIDAGYYYTYLFRTEYVVPIDTSAGEGNYIDQWGYSGVMIKTVEGGHLEVKVDDFYGDFNFDSVVNGEDFALFTNKWNRSILDGNYDLMYDATQDGWTKEDDLAIFVDNWLKERPE